MALLPFIATFRQFGITGGGDGIRTHDRLVANQVLYQLSYAPNFRGGKVKHAQTGVPRPETSLVGLSGLEPLTSRLSGGRSNQLSYRPEDACTFVPACLQRHR
jgi:hypothetical protein